MSVKKSSVKINNARRVAPRLKDRRRQGRRQIVLVYVAALIAFVAFVIWGLNQSALRISSVEFKGAEALLPGADPVALAKGALVGKYWGLIPRDSALFFPEHAMRVAVTGGHPEIAAITFKHVGLTGLVMKASVHTAVGRWCGLAPTLGVTPYCYFYDPNGFIYSAMPDSQGAQMGDANVSTSKPIAPPEADPTVKLVNSFVLYAPLAGNAQEPLRATVAHADKLPDAAAFARQMGTLGSEVQAVVIHDNDEADLILASGTRITYVLGHEQEAYSALTSAKNDLNLTNGSLDYIDLRFSGKVYLKKKGE